VPCEGGVAPLSPEQVKPLLNGLAGWALDDGMISKTFKFRNYFETMAFVNAAAWVSHREDHHPDMAVGYNECRVSYVTHAIGGLSENDFICAAKLDALFEI
jgi:4a-hydroxytetrahydrobiopterin dehydratase